MKPTHSPPTSRSYGKLAKRGLMWGLAREGARTLIIIPTSMVLARLLSPQESGIAAAGFFVVQLASRLTQFGLGVSLVRAKSITPAHVSSVFLMNLAAASLASLALLVTGPRLGGMLGSREAASILPLAGLGFIVVAFGSVPTALLARDMRYRESSTSEWLSTIVGSVSTILFAWFGHSYWSIVYGALLSDAARTVSRAFMVGWTPALSFSTAAAREMLSFGLGVYGRNLLEYFAQNIDNLIVGRLLGMTALGYYDKAFATMTKLTAKVNLAGPSVSFRAFAVLHEDQPRFKRAYRKVILSVTALGYPAMTAMAVSADELITVMFGERWQPAAQPFRVLCVVAMLRLLNTYASSATQATGNIWSEVRRQAISVVVLVLAVAALSQWGIVGAAFGVLITTVLSTMLLQVLVQRITAFDWRDLLEPQVPGLTCSLVVAGLLLAARELLAAFVPGTAAFPALLLYVVLSVACGLVFLFFAPFSEMRAVVHEIMEDLGLTPVLKRLLPLAQER